MSSRYLTIFNDRQLDAKELSENPSSNGNGATATPAHESVEEPLSPSRSMESSAFKQPEHVRKEILQLVHRVFITPPPTWSPRLVLVSAIGDGEAENVAAWTAETLASQGCGSVCLVDANTHSAKMHQVFGLPDEVGFSDYVSAPTGDAKGLRSFASAIGDSNLWLMPAGSRTADQPAITTELLVSALLGLKSTFDFVVINAPLSEKQVISTAMAPLSDGVVLVITAGDTRREIVMKTKGQLESSHARLLGAVLHKRRFPVPEFLYKWLF